MQNKPYLATPVKVIPMMLPVLSASLANTVERSERGDPKEFEGALLSQVLEAKRKDTFFLIDEKHVARVVADSLNQYLKHWNSVTDKLTTGIKLIATDMNTRAHVSERQIERLVDELLREVFVKPSQGITFRELKA